MALNQFEQQPRKAGRFEKDPNNPGKARVSLRVDSALLEQFKEQQGKGFSGELAKVIEEFLRNQLGLADMV